MRVALAYAPSPAGRSIAGYVLSALPVPDGLDLVLICEQPSWLHRASSRLRRSGVLATVRRLHNRRRSPKAHYEAPPILGYSDSACQNALEKFITTHPDRIRRVHDLGSGTRESVEHLKAQRIDLLCLIDAGGIVRRPVIDAVRAGIINAHGGGRLPEYRGSDSLEWSIWEGNRPWVNTHFVDAGIDTGPILCQTPMAVHAGDSLADLFHRRDRIRAELIVETICGLYQRRITPRLQDPLQGRVYYRMHPRLRALLPGKLEALKRKFGIL